ncbi:MAG: DNA primase [Candidatus Magasanikbacteria bacterium]|nr:DNA primase [Candidatus Magasanikbacteria bacterium]
MADTQAIKDRLDIVALIQEYVPLKKAGANWKANCPFHHEKSPSFMVQAEKQIWHCFGCGQGGDIFSFIQAIEGLEFIDALKLLGKRAGVPVDTYVNTSQESERSRLEEVVAAAANFFHHFLLEIPAAEAARAYLKKRGLNSESISEWQIGFAPDQWDLLTKYLLKKNFSLEILVKSGLTIKRDNADAQTGRGFYDRWRGRIMFPLFDAHGTIVGFTGRILVETPDTGGKYVNSPQSSLYDKSRLLYGLNLAKNEIKKQDLAVLVEGQMDVIACHQHGFKNVVAASGTALTPEQVRLLKRYTSTIAMAFDADAAGENAGRRGIDIALSGGLHIKVIEIPEGSGKDADEVLNKNPEIWQSSVNQASDVMAWYLSRIIKKFNLADPRQKQSAAEVLLTQVSQIPLSVERDDWLKKIAAALNIEAPALREELKRQAHQGKHAGGASKATGGSLASSPATPTLNAEDLAHANLQGDFWSLIIKFPNLYQFFVVSLKDELFVGSPYLGLYENCKNLYNTLGRLDLSALRQFFATENQENFIDILTLRPYKNFDELNPNVAQKELEQILARLTAYYQKTRRSALQQEITLAESQGEHERVKILLQEIQLL